MNSINKIQMTATLQSQHFKGAYKKNSITVILYNLGLLFKPFCLLLLIAVLGSSCNSTEKKEPAAKTITPAHKNIPGTHVFLIPPGGFTATSGTVKGYIKDEQTTFLSVTEFPGKNFATEAANNSAEKMQQRGYSVFMEKETTVGPYKGRLMRIGDGATSTVWQLVFGDESFAVMIMGIYPSHDELSGKQIAEAIETVMYDKDLKVDALAGLEFTILQNESRYQYLKTEAGLVIYSLDGKTDIKTDNTPFIVIAQTPRENASAKALAETAIQSTLKQNFKKPEILSEGFLTINNNNAYEMQVGATLNGKYTKIFLVTIVKNNIALMVQGMAKSNIEQTIAGYKQFADAIAIK